MMQDFHKDDVYEDGPAVSCWALGVVVCVAGLALLLAVGLLAG